MGEKHSALIVSRKQLGDLLLLIPALEQLHQRDGLTIHVNAQRGFAAFYELMACQPRPATAHTRKVFDKLYCFETGGITSLICAWARSRHKTIGLTRPALSRWQRWIFDETVLRDASRHYRGAIFHAMVGGDPEAFRPPILSPPPTDWLPTELPERYYVLHPTAAWQRKTWASASWREVMRALYRRSGLTCVLTTGSADWEMELAAGIAEDMDVPVLNLAGRTSLRSYAAVLSRAAATLCIDGSASHLSAAFGRPTLTLFGPTNPVHWHWPTPISRRLWAADYSTESKPSASAIPPAAVLDAALELLDARP